MGQGSEPPLSLLFDGSTWDSVGNHTKWPLCPWIGSSQDQGYAGAWRVTTSPLCPQKGELSLQGRAFGASLGTSSQGVRPSCQLACWGPLWRRCVGCNLITSQPTELLVGALRSQGLCACDLPVPRSPFSVIQIRYSEPFMKILIKPETAALLFHCCFVRIRSCLWLSAHPALRQRRLNRGLILWARERGSWASTAVSLYVWNPEGTLLRSRTTASIMELLISIWVDPTSCTPLWPDTQERGAGGVAGAGFKSCAITTDQLLPLSPLRLSFFTFEVASQACQGDHVDSVRRPPPTLGHRIGA